MAWKRANTVLPDTARATSAIWVLSAGGMPMRRRTASQVMVRVTLPTMASVSHSVSRPKRRRPRSSSWASWAMADEGASTPVASAIATGKAKHTAKIAERWPAAVSGGMAAAAGGCR